MSLMRRLVLLLAFGLGACAASMAPDIPSSPAPPASSQAAVPAPASSPLASSFEPMVATAPEASSAPLSMSSAPAPVTPLVGLVAPPARFSPLQKLLSQVHQVMNRERPTLDDVVALVGPVEGGPAALAQPQVALQPRLTLVGQASLLRDPTSGAISELTLSFAAGGRPVLRELREVFGPDQLRRERLHNFRRAEFHQASKGRRAEVVAQLTQGFDPHSDRDDIEPYTPNIHVTEVRFTRNGGP